MITCTVFWVSVLSYLWSYSVTVFLFFSELNEFHTVLWICHLYQVASNGRSSLYYLFSCPTTNSLTDSQIRPFLLENQNIYMHKYISGIVKRNHKSTRLLHVDILLYKKLWNCADSLPIDHEQYFLGERTRATGQECRHSLPLRWWCICCITTHPHVC